MTMKILKVKSRNYKGKQYHKYRINLPEGLLKEAGFKEGDDLQALPRDGQIELKKNKIKAVRKKL